MPDGRSKAFPVPWDQFHRDARALAWRLASLRAVRRHRRDHPRRPGAGGDHCARAELRVIETVCIASYHDYKNQGGLQVLKTIAPDIAGSASGAEIWSSTISSTPARPPRSCARCCPRRISPPFTPSRSAGRWSTRSSPKSRRTPGSTSPGTWASPSSRRSPRTRRAESARVQFRAQIVKQAARADVAKPVDAKDLKSFGRKAVRVRPPPSAPWAPK